MKRGREAIRNKDYDAAEAQAARLEAAGHLDLARLLRGELLLEEGRPGNALRELNQITGEGEVRLRAATISGRCLLELGNLREAHRAFSYVLERDPDDVDAHRGMAAIAYDLGNLTAALIHLNRVTNLAPQDGRSYRLIGLIRTYLSQDELAEAAYRTALERDLPDAFRKEIYLELAENLLRRTLYAQALKELDRRAELDGEEDAAGLGVRAECLNGLGRGRELAPLLERAMAAYPREWHFFVLRGQLYLDEKEPEKAIQVLLRALDLAPGEYRVRFTLAKAFSAAGRTADAAEQEKFVKKARDNMKKVYDLSYEAMQKPWDATIRLELAEVCDEMGNRKLAAMWRKAAKACKTEE